MDSRNEDYVLSVAISLAKEATMLFQSGEYAECVDVLKQLSQKKENDPKVEEMSMTWSALACVVFDTAFRFIGPDCIGPPFLLSWASLVSSFQPVLHNTALAEFFRGGCSELKRFLEELINVEKKCADLARESAEQRDATLPSGSSTSSASDGSNVVGPLVHAASSASVVFRDEFDAPVATLNKAVILYHLHDYPKAIKVLEPLFQNIEPIDEGTALHVCLLLLELALSTQDAPKFADVVSYVEKAFRACCVDNQADNRGVGQLLPNLASKSTSVPSTTSIPDLNLEASADISEDSLPRTLSDESVEYETLLSRFGMSAQSLSKLSILLGSTDSPSTPSNRLPSVDLKLNLPLCRVQLSFLTKNLKVAKRDLKSAMKIARGRDYSSALLLKSQLELARGDFVKAERLLKATYKRKDVGSSIIYNNNVGCIFYQWGKHNAAGVFFNKALHKCSSLHTKKPRNLARVSQDRSMLVMYNSGLHYMACGDPILAARCFEKASLVFYNKPLLWLRLAECSLIALDKGLSKPFDQLLSGPEFEASVIGQGKWRQLAVGGVVMQEGHGKSNVGCERSHNLSLSFARECLLTALLLVRNMEPEPGKIGLPLKTTPGESSAVGATKGSKNTSSSSQANKDKDATSSSPSYEDICRRETYKIIEAILANLAFVELVLENPVGALARAQSLLEVPECSKMSAFLARVYSAEALCLLNRPEKAAELLSVYFSSGRDIDLPYTTEDYKRWQVNKPLDPDDSNAGSVGAKNPVTDEAQDSIFCKPEEAQGALYVNLATASSLQGDLELAVQYATRALSLIPNSREANLMAVYLDLKRGRVEEARSRLRGCTCVRCTSSVSRSEGSS